jgi:lysine 2,3-aminomutase
MSDEAIDLAIAPNTNRPRVFLRTPDQLVERGLVPSAQRAAIERVCQEFSLAVSPEMVELINPDDPADPVAAQFVPDARELIVQPAEMEDPIGEDVHNPVPGVLHRYPDRVLLKPVHVCPVYCRFCFRREKVGIGGEGNLSSAELKAALDYISLHTEIWEVVLSGGDPMILAPRKIKDIIQALDSIAHVKVIRVHTRVPVVDPARVSAEMIDALKVSTPVYVVLHANHANEFSDPARAAIARLVDAGIPMLSQSTLLRGVNDSVEALTGLLRTMVENRVKPYYLHHADKARGTGHFRTSVAEGQALLRALRGNVSGICQPAYILDLPGGFGKMPVGPVYAVKTDSGYVIEDYQGGFHDYEDAL